MKRSVLVASGLAMLLLTSSCTKPAQPGAKAEAAASQAAIPLVGSSVAPAQSAAPAPASAPNGQRVSGAEARALVAKGATLVDVRTPAEFQTDGIPSAMNVPYDQIESRAGELGSKDRSLVLYCHSGRRSGIAARTLVRLGYSSVYDLGPRSAW